MVREVEEETGLHVASTELLGINSFTIQGAADDFQSIQIIYRAQVLGGKLRNELEGTTDLCAWHPNESITDLTTVELVEHAMSLCEI